jgi:uncharacterized protein (TIGR00288 family)
MTDRQNDTKSMALFCDFENVALGVREAKYQDFDINKVLERLLLKGSIVVKKAYCDWGRYREFKATMHQASFELIEIPHVRMSGKNSADIRMVVDALDLCYTKSHVDTFVIISGDSDFSPLVSKLRENAKTVIGVGVKNSTSELLINNCDEFIYYDDLVRVAAARPSRRRTGERSGERSGERTHERGAERTGERTGERGLERLAERGGDRPADRGADRGAERNADRPADRSPDRGADRGADRTRRPQPRRGGIADPAVPASMAAPEDGVVAVAVPSEPVETMLSVSADVIAHLAGDSVADVADADADIADASVIVTPRPAARRPRRKAGAVAAEAVSSAVSAVSVPLDVASMQPSSDLVGPVVDEPPAAPARRRRTRKTAEAVDVVEATQAAEGGDVTEIPVVVADPGAALADAIVLSSPEAASEPRETSARPARGRQRGRGAEAALVPAPVFAEAPPEEAADRGRDGARDGARDGGRDESRDEGREEARDQQSDDRRLQALELVVGMIEALAAERGDGEKIWGSMVKQTLKRRKPGFNESYYGFRSFNRLLEEARDRGLIELDLDDKSGGYTVRSLA